MVQILQSYLQQEETFIAFGRVHIVSIMISLILIIMVPYVSWRYFSKKQQDICALFLVWFVCLVEPIKIGMEVIGGTFDISTDLPLHLCRFVSLLLPVLYYTKNLVLFNVLFYWSLSGALQSILTPTIDHPYYHFLYLKYWITHSGAILCLIYMLVIYRLRPLLYGVLHAFIATNIFIVFSVFVNIVLKSNYFYVCYKPSVPTLLDYLGPWPWYLLLGDLVALIHFFAAYFVYAFFSKFVYEKYFFSKKV